MKRKKAPSELLQARRALEEIGQVTLLQDLTWNAADYKWVLHCQLQADVLPNGPIPALTNWYVLIDPGYPWGTIQFYPAKNNGITQTFPHQSYNAEGKEDVLWREGNLCLSTDVAALGRQGYDTEPYEVNCRLLWHFKRALTWLEAASRNRLVLPNEPFELPWFPKAKSNDSYQVVFAEDERSFCKWQQIGDECGLAKMATFTYLPKTLVVKCFNSLTEKELLCPRWGLRLNARGTASCIGLWLRLKETPVLPPWQAPTTWGELRQVCHLQGIKIDELMKKSVRFIRSLSQTAFVLLGFPIPNLVGEPACQMHWQAIQLPPLSQGKNTAQGFRPNEKGYWHRDRTEILRDEAKLKWITSENWHETQVTTRGHLPLAMTKAKILLIGGGALGSAVAELLVRAGVKEITIIDGDQMKVGNLVRHTLDMTRLNISKARAIAERLNLTTPYAFVTSINTFFPPSNEIDIKRVNDCEVVIDCTGEDEVLHRLEIYPWNEVKTFFSISTGMYAQRLFCFAIRDERFPRTKFMDQIQPWIAKERRENEGAPLPREGIGCWHPVFPARADDLWLLAATAIKYIASTLASPIQPELTIFEQSYEGKEFMGLGQVKRVSVNE